MMENKSIWALKWDGFFETYTFEEIEIIKETEKMFKLKSNKCYIRQLNKSGLYIFNNNKIYGFDKKKIINIAIEQCQAKIKYYQEVADSLKKNIRTLLKLKSEEQDDK